MAESGRDRVLFGLRALGLLCLGGLQTALVVGTITVMINVGVREVVDSWVWVVTERPDLLFVRPAILALWTPLTIGVVALSVHALLKRRFSRVPMAGKAAD